MFTGERAYMHNWGEGLSLVFSKQKYAVLFFALLLFLIPLYSILTNIVVLEPLSLNPNLKLPEVPLIALIALLASVGFTIAAYQFSELHSASRKSIGGSMLGAGMGGSVLATFASSCAICQPVWLFWLGLGSATAFLADYSIHIELASLAILFYSVHSGLNAITRGCKIQKRQGKPHSIVT